MASAINSRQLGFTLLEISIVLLIIASVLGGGMMIFSASLQQQQVAATQSRLELLQRTLLDYRRAFNRIPCPADVTLKTEERGFGVEVGTPGDGNCAGSNFTAGAIVEGMVPTKTLQLPDEYGFDGWGRRIMYVVDSRSTTTNAFSNIGVTDTGSRITIVPSTGMTSKTTGAMYALISFGEDGHGGYPRAGGSARINAQSVNTDELTNCSCRSDGTSLAPLGTTLVQKQPTENPNDLHDRFDDVVVYSSRRDLRALSE